MSIFDASRRGRATQFGRIFPADAAWLATSTEAEVIEPALAIIDTHHHFWNLPNDVYGVDAFIADKASGHNVTHSVFVECGMGYRPSGPEHLRPVGETEYVVGLTGTDGGADARLSGVAAGIVGYADLTLGDAVEDVLAEHIRVGRGAFKGIRYATGWDDDPIIGNSHNVSHGQALLDTRVITGLKKVQQMGLTFDAWVFHPQLDEVCVVADAVDSLPIVLGHCGGPLGYGPYRGRQDEIFGEWKRALSNVAKRENINIKLGGMMMRLAAFDYCASETAPSSAQLAALWRPYIETCIERFGVDRCMFESNFPVEKMGCDYRTLWNAFKRITAGASQADKAALYSGTAARVYRL